MTSNEAQWDGTPALLPLSWIYRAGVASARAFHAAPKPGGPAPRVVAVGNLEVGGSGKTPLCAWLVERATRGGKRAAYASRGFGGAAEHGPWVTVVLGEGAGAPSSLAGLRVLARQTRDLAAAFCDEGAVVAERVRAASLFVSRDKRRAVEAAARWGAEIVVVDDAFQSFALPRHLDVLLLDARRPVANGRVLPAGRLRETPSAIARADVVVFNGAADRTAVEEARARVARWLRSDARVYGLRRTVTLTPTVPAAGSPADALLVAGIARPADFRTSVEMVAERAGLRVIDALAFRDHHRYTDSDVRAIRARAQAGAIVTTEKDWVKLSHFDWEGSRVWVARLEVELVGEADVDAWLTG